jgi:hypothetical protein
MTNGLVIALGVAVLGVALQAGVAVQAGIAPSDGAPVTGNVARYDAPATRSRPVLEDDVVAGCLGCHRDSLSLAEAEVEPLAEAIAAITRNEANHIVPIAALSEEDLMALAKALAEPDDESP